MRRVTERLEGYAFAVALQHPPQGDPNAIVAEVVFADHVDPNATSHTVVIPLTAAGKQRLIAQLTGGVIVT